MRTYKLSRPKDHRTGLVKNLATSLIVYEKIVTTLPKAKLAQSYVERLISNVKKTDKVNGYRLALAALQTEKAAQKTTDIIKSRFASTDGGFTRIIKLSPRHGDNALKVMLELTIKTELPAVTRKDDQTEADKNDGTDKIPSEAVSPKTKKVKSLKNNKE